MNGITRIHHERLRQQDVEGWSAEHDDAHTDGELVKAAICYLYATRHLESYRASPPAAWPWAREWWKPSDAPIRNLEKAGALIAAEIDRLLRLKTPQPSNGDEAMPKVAYPPDAQPIAAKVTGLSVQTITGSESRKATPLFSGCIAYFPDALAAVARLSRIGNEKHNPGQPLHWSKHLSSDHADCLARHLVDHGKIDPETGLSHTVAVAWRALALLQMEIENARGKPAAA